VNSVQTLIDGLAERIGQPVGIDDRRFRSVAYSSHADEIDPVRRRSILGRQAPEQVTAWLERLGVARASGEVHVPANPGLSMVPRVCFPVRFHGRLLGYLWLTEDRGPVSDVLLAEAERFTTEIAEELFRLDQEESDDHRREAEAVRRLTEAAGGKDGTVRRASQLASAAWYSVAVVDATGADVSHGPETDVRLTAATGRARRALPPRHLLSLVADGRAVVVLAGTSSQDLERAAAALLTSAELELADLEHVAPVVGLGGPRTQIEHLPVVRHQAELAVRVARAATTHGPLATWVTLEAYRLVSELAEGRDAHALVPDVLRELFGDPDAATLVRTLEAYLEHGGDAPAAAAELFIHRSSLYNRLRRVEELAGVDMRSGSDRLELHLGLRLWRLASLSTGVGNPDLKTRQPRTPAH
jgi:sugar diacid utilization regulator